MVCKRELLIDLFWQRIDIGILKLGNFAVLGDQVDNRVLAAQFIELAGGRAVAGFALFNTLSWQFKFIQTKYRPIGSG